MKHLLDPLHQEGFETICRFDLPKKEIPFQLLLKSQCYLRGVMIHNSDGKDLSYLQFYENCSLIIKGAQTIG